MKTAEKLKISEKMYRALIRVRDGLRDGRFVHVEDFNHAPKGRLFNMNFDDYQKDCKTIHCIGGWVAKEAKLPVNEVVWHTPSLEKLFFPYALNTGHWNSITPKMAARAITNVLKTGSPKWREAAKGYKRY